MKRTIKPEGVPVDDEGRYWVYYKTGEHGNRDAYGYIRPYLVVPVTGCYTVNTLMTNSVFSCMTSAACHLKAISK